MGFLHWHPPMGLGEQVGGMQNRWRGCLEEGSPLYICDDDADDDDDGDDEKRVHQKSIWSTKFLHVVFLPGYVLRTK